MRTHLHMHSTYEHPSTVCINEVTIIKITTEGLGAFWFFFKAVVNTVGGLMASRRVFCWLPFVFFLFLIDKLRRKHPFKHANKKKLARIASLYKYSNL